MEHHESECFLIKQTQDNDMLRLIRAFELNSSSECSKIEHVLKLIKANYEDEINNCMYSLCIVDIYIGPYTYRFKIEKKSSH